MWEIQDTIRVFFKWPVDALHLCGNDEGSWIYCSGWRQSSTLNHSEYVWGFYILPLSSCFVSNSAFFFFLVKMLSFWAKTRVSTEEHQKCQVSCERLTWNIQVGLGGGGSSSCLQARVGEHPGLFSSASNRSTGLPCRLKDVSPLIFLRSEEDTRNPKDIHI